VTYLAYDAAADEYYVPEGADQDDAEDNVPELDSGDIDPNWEDPDQMYPPHEFGDPCDCSECYPDGPPPECLNDAACPDGCCG